MRQSRWFKASDGVKRAGGAFSPMWNNLPRVAARHASMSRNDPRHVICAKAITRNRSAQPRVRTAASPLCRSTIRPKVFHGKNSITGANSVLPTFMRHSGPFKPGSIANRKSEIQIVDTHESTETRVSTGFATR
jgi:hypothetical protein